MHSTESSIVTGPSHTLSDGVYVCTLQPGNFTWRGSEGVSSEVWECFLLNPEVWKSFLLNSDQKLVVANASIIFTIISFRLWNPFTGPFTNPFTHTRARTHTHSHTHTHTRTYTHTHTHRVDGRPPSQSPKNQTNKPAPSSLVSNRN